MPVRINALIATYGRADLLRRTLDSLAQAHGPQGFEQVWVVENGSETGAREVCRAMGNRLRIEYDRVAQPGKSRALQHTLGRIKSGFVIFFDDDIRVVPGVLEAYAQAFRTHGESVFYGGPFEVDYEEAPPQWLKAYLPPSAVGWALDQTDNPLAPRYFLGFNYAADVEKLLSVGGFNPNLGPGAMRAGTEGNPTGQEYEMQKRLLDAGCGSVYVPEAKVWHYVPKSRCTPAWALHRLYRGAMSRALIGDPAEHAPQWFGTPRWMWRRAVRMELLRLRSYFQFDAERRFRMKVQPCEWRGLMAGTRKRIAMTADGPQHHQSPGKTDVDDH